MPIADNPASVEQLGRLRSSVTKQIDALTQQIANANNASAVAVPVVDGGVTPVYSVGKKNKHVRVTLAFASFGNAVNLRLTMIDRAEVVTSDDYIQKRFHAELADDIDAN